MGVDQSQHMNSSWDTSFETEEEIIDKPGQQEMGEIMLLKKEFEIEAKYFREKFQVLDQRTGIMKVENNFLRGQVAVITGKVETLKNSLDKLEIAKVILESDVYL